MEDGSVVWSSESLLSAIQSVYVDSRVRVERRKRGGQIVSAEGETETGLCYVM